MEGEGQERHEQRWKDTDRGIEEEAEAGISLRSSEKQTDVVVKT